MLSINLTEVQNKEHIALVIRSNMENNGIKKRIVDPDSLQYTSFLRSLRRLTPLICKVL